MIDPVNPAGFLFQAVSDLTGGMVTDIKTAMVAMVTVSVILMGLDYLKDIFFESFQASNDFNARIKARDEFINAGKRAGRTESEIEKDENELSYESARKKYSKHF